METGKVLSVTVLNPPKERVGAICRPINNLHAQLAQAISEVLGIDPDKISIESRHLIAEDHLNFESATVLVCCEWFNTERRDSLDDKKVRDVVFKLIGTLCGAEYDPNSPESLHLRRAVAIDDWKTDPDLFLITGRVCRPR